MSLHTQHQVPLVINLSKYKNDRNILTHIYINACVKSSKVIKQVQITDNSRYVQCNALCCKPIYQYTPWRAMHTPISAPSGRFLNYAYKNPTSGFHHKNCVPYEPSLLIRNEVNSFLISCPFSPSFLYFLLFLGDGPGGKY